MYEIAKVTALPNYTIQVEFDDGVRGKVDLSDRLFGPMFEPLKDETFFAKVSVDEYGVVCWPNEADLAPDALYKEITNNKTLH